MTQLILFNKPFNVLCQFTDSEQRPTLADYISIPHIYPAGRLDKDSEGLLLLTDNGKLQHQISHPKHKLFKYYWVQVEGAITAQAITQLQQGVQLKDGISKAAKITPISTPPSLWQRIPAIRERQHIPTSWLNIGISEGRNRQVRRMTAAVGFPTLRLIRHTIGHWQLGNITPGTYQLIKNPVLPLLERKKFLENGKV